MRIKLDNWSITCVRVTANIWDSEGVCSCWRLSRSKRRWLRSASGSRRWSQPRRTWRSHTASRTRDEDSQRPHWLYHRPWRLKDQRDQVRHTICEYNTRNLFGGRGGVNPIPSIPLLLFLSSLCHSLSTAAKHRRSSLDFFCYGGALYSNTWTNIFSCQCAYYTEYPLNRLN